MTYSSNSKKAPVIFDKGVLRDLLFLELN